MLCILVFRKFDTKNVQMNFLPKNKKWTSEAACFKSPYIKRFSRFGVRKVLLSIRGFAFRKGKAEIAGH